MFSIKVVDSSNDRPLVGEKVAMEVKCGLFCFGFLPDKYTNADGEVEYDGLDDVELLCMCGVRLAMMARCVAGK